MKKNVLSTVVVSMFVALSGMFPALADVTLPKVIDSNMVLQQKQPLPIWGKADPGEKVVVKIDRAEVSTTADAKGDWKVELPAMKADGKTHQMTVSGKNEIKLDNILIGEVWLGSGQSNMKMGINACGPRAKKDAAAANYPKIRLFSRQPKNRAPGPWAECSPTVLGDPAYGNWGGFSGALFYFGERLHKELDVPIGLISSTKGGTPIAAWTPPDGELHTSMTAPVVPFAIRGMIWYQGEANLGMGLKYAESQKTLIKSLRGLWGYDFPFHFVQLPPYKAKGKMPTFWEAQASSLKIPDTGMIVTTDIGGSVHPLNKWDVGSRLALWALAKQYKKEIVYSGPLYKSKTVNGNKIQLTFAHGGGLKSRDGKPLNLFEIAGADGKYVPANAVIQGDMVVVGADGVASPVNVRFGWNEVVKPNLVNEAGLPASPFQTDNWTGGTGE